MYIIIIIIIRFTNCLVEEEAAIIESFSHLRLREEQNQI